jgi:predicted metalloprotease
VKGRLGHSERGRMVPNELVSALMAMRRGGRWSVANAPVKSWAGRGV